MVYLLFTDETNQQAAHKAKFFIYGGVLFPVERLTEVHNLVEQARRKNGFRQDDEFKFETHSRPDHVTKEQHRAAKRAVLEGCSELGVRFVACLVLHDIARTRLLQELVSWGANSVICAFHRFLEQENGTGICTVDRLPFDQNYQYLKEKFQVGLTFPNGHSRPLDRIQLFASTSQGASHASSAIDIVLGAFRYCVNERDRNIAPRDMFPKIVRMMWHRRERNRIYLREYGLLFRPRRVRVEAHQREYGELTEHLARLLKEVPETAYHAAQTV
jgi:hypothetical protein